MVKHWIWITNVLKHDEERCWHPNNHPINMLLCADYFHRYFNPCIPPSDHILDIWVCLNIGCQQKHAVSNEILRLSLTYTNLGMPQFWKKERLAPHRHWPTIAASRHSPHLKASAGFLPRQDTHTHTLDIKTPEPCWWTWRNNQNVGSIRDTLWWFYLNKKHGSPLPSWITKSLIQPQFPNNKQWYTAHPSTLQNKQDTGAC